MTILTVEVKSYRPPTARRRKKLITYSYPPYKDSICTGQFRTTIALEVRPWVFIATRLCTTGAICPPPRSTLHLPIHPVSHLASHSIHPSIHSASHPSIHIQPAWSAIISAPADYNNRRGAFLGCYNGNVHAENPARQVSIWNNNNTRVTG